MDPKTIVIAIMCAIAVLCVLFLIGCGLAVFAGKTWVRHITQPKTPCDILGCRCFWCSFWREFERAAGENFSPETRTKLRNYERDYSWRLHR